MGNITSADSVLLIGVLTVFPLVQQLQGFGADDAYDVDDVDPAEVIMGVDAIQSAGWIPQIKNMKIVLQADSLSIPFFEAWYAAQEAARTTFQAFGLLRQPAINRVYTLTGGTLSGYKPFAGAGKVLKARNFSVKWNIALGAPTG